MKMINLNLFENDSNNSTTPIITAAHQLAISFSDESEIPAKFKKNNKKQKKNKEDTIINKRFKKKVELWKEVINKILQSKGENIGWRFIRLSPIIEMNIESVVQCNDFNIFLDYLIQQRDIDNCNDDELGCLAMLHTSFQGKIEKTLKSRYMNNNNSLQDNNDMNSPLSFTAIDFETAQGSRISICQVGIVRVENNIITERYSILIQPPENKYQNSNIDIHGITPEMTEYAKPFPEIWPKIKPYIEGQLVVAHNASFDIDALKKTLFHFNIEIPKFDYDCTYIRLGKSLEELCFENSIYLNHHEGLSDAEACAKLYLKCHNKPLELSEPRQKSKNNRISLESKNWHKPIAKDLLQPNFENADESSPFYMQKVIITGTFDNWPDRDDLGIILKDYGADINSSISSKTNLVVVGKNAGPSKLKKVESLQAQGNNIKIIYEDEILEILTELESLKQQ